MKYVEALNQALHQILKRDKHAVLIGQGVTSPWYVGTATRGLQEEFGSSRVIDTPVSENAVTGMAIGAALTGLHPIVMHPRMDFMYYALDQIANHACNWQTMFGNQMTVPIVFWAIINRGGEQAAQHSQALHGLFAHLPGLKVVAPSTPYDVKGLLMSCVKLGEPVLFVDDRWLYQIEGNVPDSEYYVPVGKADVCAEGEDVTVATSGFLVHEALKAHRILDGRISIEVVDLRTLKPLDKAMLFESVKKTGRLVVVDGGWKTCGFSAEVSALVVENIFGYLEAPIHRVALPDSSAPASSSLEAQYYRNADNIAQSVKIVMEEGRELQGSLRELPIALPAHLD